MTLDCVTRLPGSCACACVCVCAYVYVCQETSISSNILKRPLCSLQCQHVKYCQDRRNGETFEAGSRREDPAAWVQGRHTIFTQEVPEAAVHPPARDRKLSLGLEKQYNLESNHSTLLVSLFFFFLIWKVTVVEKISKAPYCTTTFCNLKYVECQRGPKWVLCIAFSLWWPLCLPAKEQEECHIFMDSPFLASLCELCYYNI